MVYFQFDIAISQVFMLFRKRDTPVTELLTRQIIVRQLSHTFLVSYFSMKTRISRVLRTMTRTNYISKNTVLTETS